MTEPTTGTTWESPAPQHTAGWYPDPLDRFDSRYHNGDAWTADVSQGGERYVDPLGTGPGRDLGARNGMAIAALVLGVIGVGIGWMPFLVVIGLVAAILAIIFGVIGLRRSRELGVGRSQAIVGLTTGGCGLAASVLGVLLTVAVLDLVDAYENPNPNSAVIDTCSTNGDVVTAAGHITNHGDSEADFVVRVDFLRAGTDNAHRKTNVSVDDVQAGETSSFTVTRVVGLEDVECVVSRVTGPLPFGLDLEP